MEEKEKGCVYFFRHIGLTPVKIGFSTSESPLNRFTQFKTYAPYGSEILGFIQTEDAKKIESILHLKYSNKRISGEWFEISEQDVTYEVNFYSNIEDIKERNEFQIEWAKRINEKKITKEKIIENIISSEKDIFFKWYKENPKLNRTQAANNLKVSRQCIQNWIKSVNQG